MTFDPFSLALGAAVALLVYAIVIRFVPGTQPGEAALSKIADRIIAAVEKLAHRSTASQTPAPAPIPAPPAAAAPIPAAPQPPAAPSAPAPVSAPLPPTPAVAPKPEQTWAQWIVANHPEALPRLGALLAAANGLPGSLTYAEMWDVINAPAAPQPQQAGDSWSQWTGAIPVTSLDRADLSFAQTVETTRLPTDPTRTYGSLFWLDKIGGTEGEVKAWRELGADPRFDVGSYAARDPHGLVAAALIAGVPL